MATKNVVDHALGVQSGYGDAKLSGAGHLTSILAGEELYSREFDLLCNVAVSTSVTVIFDGH